MASSEIEVTESSGGAAAGPQDPPGEAAAAAAAVDVFSAAAYGDLEKLSKFVEQDGASLSAPDANGYYALQWAALNNFADVVQYIIEVFALPSLASSSSSSSSSFACAKGFSRADCAVLATWS